MSNSTIFSVSGDQTFINGEPALIKGLRTSNALVSDRSAARLIENLPVFAGYGVNTVSVFWMGSRFGDVIGYREDASIDPIYAARMSRILEAADALGMIVLVGCLYWGNSKAKWESWTQRQANAAVANTVRWLRERDYRNVFLDVDNEGMALVAKGFDNRELVLAGKAVDASYFIGTNFRGDPPPEADLALHFSNRASGKPFIETEGSVGPYWGSYSRHPDLYDYLNIGVHSPAMQREQNQQTAAHFARGEGYMMASTWLQAPPPAGPHMEPGGDGSLANPGVRWWLEHLRDHCGGAYRAPAEVEAQVT